MGYGIFPAGKYFNQEGFSFLIWMKVSTYIYNQTIIDFANGNPSDNVLYRFELFSDELYLHHYQGSSQRERSPLSKGIALNKWIHIAVTLSQNIVVLYMDGIEEFSFNAPLNDVVRTKNFIGYNNWGEGDGAHSIFDEMKIFDRELTSEEIKAEKDMKQPFKIIEN